MAKASGTASNGVHSPSSCEDDPDSRPAPSTSHEVPTESQQDKRAGNGTNTASNGEYAASSEKGVVDFSEDESSSGDDESPSCSRMGMSIDLAAGPSWQPHPADDQYSSDDGSDSSSYDSPRSSPDVDIASYSSDGSTSPDNSPRSSPKKVNSASPVELFPAVGGPPPFDGAEPLPPKGVKPSRIDDVEPNPMVEVNPRSIEDVETSSIEDVVPPPPEGVRSPLSDDVGSSSPEAVGPSTSEAAGPSTSEDARSSFPRDLGNSYSHDGFSMSRMIRDKLRPSDPRKIGRDALSVHSSLKDGPATWEEDSTPKPPRMIPFDAYIISEKSVEVKEILTGAGSSDDARLWSMEKFPLGRGIDGKFSAVRGWGKVWTSPRGPVVVEYRSLCEERDEPGFPGFGDMAIFNVTNRVLDAVGHGRKRTEKSGTARWHDHGVHVDVCNEEGEVKSPNHYSLIEWLAVLRALVLSTRRDNVHDTFSEYFRKRPMPLQSLLARGREDTSDSFKAILQWAQQTQDEIRRQEHALHAKQGLVSVALLDMFVAVRNLPEYLAINEEDVAKAFFDTLKPLRSFYHGVRNDASFLQQQQVCNALQATMGHLVSCVSPYTFDWVEKLDLLVFFDPALEFIHEWAPFRFGDMGSSEVFKVGKNYEEAVRKVFRDSCLRSALGSALRAAPTVPDFFRAARGFEEKGWLNLENSRIQQHVVEAFGAFFAGITGRYGKPGARRARLQRHLDLALELDTNSIYSFLDASFRAHLVDVLQEILDLEEQPQGVMAAPLAFISRGKSIRDIIFNVFTSPHAFSTPLQACEVRFIQSLAASQNAKRYDAGKAALVTFANQQALDDEVLKIWIPGAARSRVASHAVSLPPHSFLAVLEELLDAGLGAPLASRLSKMAMSMAVHECRSLPAFLQDSQKISPSQAKLVQDHYVNAATAMLEAEFRGASQTRNQLGKMAVDSLLAVCQQTSRGTLFFLNPLGEQLCEKLLDTTMKACSNLQEELDARPIETVVKFKFATVLMQIEKCPQSVKAHALYTSIRKAFETLGSSLKSGLVSLRYIDLEPVRRDWEKVFQIYGNPSFLNALKEAHRDLTLYKKRLHGFKVLVVDIFQFLTENHITVEACTNWREWYVKRSSEWETFTFNEVHSSPNHWPSEVQKAIYDYLDPVIDLHRSRIFLNVLLEAVLNHGNEVSLSTVAGVVFPQAVKQYQDDMRIFVAHDINFERIVMERVCILLNEVARGATETEFELARRQLGWGSTKTHDLLKPDKEINLMDYLQDWKGVPVLRELHVILQLVASVFELDQACDGLVARIWNVISECTPLCSLRHFREVLQNGGNELLAEFTPSEVDTLRVLSKAGDLIIFLNETVQEELRHLLDAVEDTNATQTWEGLINDLIDLQRIFRPILGSSMKISFKDLRASILGELKTSSSSVLCAKLKACNKEASKLQQYFKGVANRTHKDNDMIAVVLESGEYHFSLSEAGCSLELKCHDASQAKSSTASASSQAGKSFNLPALLELRSRARWNLTSNANLKNSKATQEAFGIDEETIDTSDKSAALFICHIDVAEQIVAVLTKLHNCGHFSYAKVQRVVPSFAELQILADALKLELRTWEGAMARARSDFLCLNFFRSVELRMIVEALMIDENSTQVEHCLDLFKWAGVPSVNAVAVRRVATRGRIASFITRDGKGDMIYNCFRVISAVIEESIFQHDFSKKSAAIDVPEGRQGIILADVDDAQNELDAVATLFAERSLVLHGNASHVIVCSPSTAWEDIYLLLLRYLNNVGQTNSFYCIASIEKLSFECLSQLLPLLQTFVQDYPWCKNELALISCSRSKVLQTLSQRLQIQVRHMASVTTDAISNEVDGRYSKMWVVTSDLPGMGKTRHVKKHAETNHLDCMRTLTLSGKVSRNLLIKRLKELFRNPPFESVSSIFLHLDISVCSNPETLNDLLFELLVLGCLKSADAGLFHLTTRHVAIEVANTYQNFLASKLPVCRWFKTEHLMWNIHNFVPDSNDDQLVYNYLQNLDAGEVDRWNANASGGNLKTIPLAECRQLLQQHFVEHLRDKRSISFSLLQTFTRFFAQQLREFSACPFFAPSNLGFMRALPNTRSTVVRSILEVSRDLAMRSVKVWLDEQRQLTTSSNNAEALMAARMDNMQRWSDSKHVMIFFQKLGQINVLYKDPSHVPIPLVDLIRKQNGKLPHYGALKSEALYKQLWPILHKSQPPAQDSSYVLTADNFLKMALIFTKVKASVPVVIMGETGCGKTSLLRELAYYCSVVFRSITLHAGTTEDDIRVFLNDAEIQASKNLVWAFLDEINACDHLGFLVGIVCHHLLDGKPLHTDLKILAACNPYRKHDSRKQRAGLSARRMLKSGNLEHLDTAYTVHPLPEALVENVQDFGVLNPKDEQLYIEAMVHRSKKDKDLSFPFVKLLVMSQAFVKGRCGEASVSLRDARRCIDLFEFFNKDLASRPGLPPDRRERRAALLAFAHCYYYRLADNVERAQFKAEYVKIMNSMKWSRRIFTLGLYSEEKFENELFEEQMTLLNHMEIEPGIAKNQALRENVFVTLTCILLKIPLFVVGKPGSGKTLSLQLIFSNLRGNGMKDPYFRNKPTMFMFSYQGSESSTSEGILKVFEKAYRCVEDNKKKNVNSVVVVVLDEVGLAEISSHNPLKVLHSLLEPEGEQQVAVVGISNWSLDAAKMNRAIHISQPDPPVDDLAATGGAILDSYGMRKIYGEDQRLEMKGLAKVYHEYHEKQSKADFHGLRDFYSLIKSVRGDPVNPKKWTPDDVKQALWRNFGGSPNDVDLLRKILSVHFPKLRFDPPPALDLVKANLDDRDARHLMLISTGESGIGIVESMLPQEKLIILHGSKYREDCSDDYAYLMLSNIILHMEAGRHIVLKGVERIWSSLYDMLNQHYTVVSGRRNCRIAIGAFSNPMCFVHENFRCIVVVDQSQVANLDPPFLNRFEKQVLTWEAMLTPQLKDIANQLKKFVKAMACIDEERSFCESDLFANFSPDTIASLVLVVSETMSPSNTSAFLDRCKEELFATAFPDGIMRAHYSNTCLQEASDAKKWTDHFFQKPGDQETLAYKIHHHIGDKALWKDNLGVKLVVTTRSNIHTDIRWLLEMLPLKIQIIKLGDFTAERQLNTAVNQWSKSNNDLLIIQSDTVFDRDHLPLAKVHVERARAALLAQAQVQSRHIVFVLHSHRGEQHTASPFSFLSGWKQITLDQLHHEQIDYREYLDKSISELLQSEKVCEASKLMVKALRWSFLCIQYPRGYQAANYCQKMVEQISNDKDLCDCFMQRAVTWLEEEAKHDSRVWQTSVVCNRGRLALASNLHYAFLQYIEEKFREPIARLVYVLERQSALGSYFHLDDLQKKGLWRRVFRNKEIISIESVPQPMHPEGYTIKDPVELHVPFSSLYAEHVDTLQELYVASKGRSLALEMARDVTARLQGNELMQSIEQFALESPHDYCHDFAVLYAPYQSNLRPASEALVFEWLLRENESEPKPLLLHRLVWTKLETLKAQALLASSCFTEDEILAEVNMARSSNVVLEDFDDKFASKCVMKMLPLDPKPGGLEKWLHQFSILIKLVSNISIKGQRFASIMLMLHVLQDFAQLVIRPLELGWEELCSLAKWFERQRFAPTSELLINKITSFVPNMNSLQGERRDVYFRFVASIFIRILDFPLVTKGGISAMSAVLFNLKTPTCLMKGVVARLLDTATHLLVPADARRGVPPCLELFNSTESVIKEQAWGSDSHALFVLLSDVIFESVTPFITPELMSGKDTEAFSFQEFLSCVRLMTKELLLSSGKLNLRAACSFAVLRSIVQVLAQDLVTVLKKDPGIFNPGLAPDISRALVDFFMQGHANVSALKHYLMKVLRYHRDLSIQDVGNLANECFGNKALRLYRYLLDWDKLKEVDNPLGFNPFTTLFPSCKKAMDKLLWNTVHSDSQSLQVLRPRIQDLGVDKQGGMASSVASEIFLQRASRNLNEKETIFAAWLQQEGTLQSWDKNWVDTVHCLIAPGPLQLTCRTTTSEELQFRALAAHILLVVSSLPPLSPLRGYLNLDVESCYVLAIPDSVLASLRGALNSREKLGEYRHECGYVYTIGNCTQANQRAKCPQCKGKIGGVNHILDGGNSSLGSTAEIGYITDHVARSDTMYTVRGLEMKAFRALRLVAHICILLGVYKGKAPQRVALKLNCTPAKVVEEVKAMVEDDLVKLGTLLNINREVTTQFMHCVVSAMATHPLPAEPLTSPEKRAYWETSFGQVVNRLSLVSIVEYIDAHRGRHELTELLEERRYPPFPAATAAFTRISVSPSFRNYEAMYLQDENRKREFPIVDKFLSHMESLRELKHVMGLMRFSRAVHEQLSSKVTRAEAASSTIGEHLAGFDDRHTIHKWFLDFTEAWNALRSKVTAYECTEFRDGIREMNGDAPLALVLVESRDLGIFLAAILDYLRTIQNAFLTDVGSSHSSVRIHMCKAEEVISFDEQRLHTAVREAAMANLQFGQGKILVYDDYTIAQHLHNQVVDQKSILDNWEPFLYKHEAFHKHMTILSDVEEAIRQVPLGSETLQGIQSEIEFTGTVGAGRFLATLDLCLGFLRRTGGDPRESLGSYCNRWLGDEALLIVRMRSFDAVQLQHVVSLYEGLEDSASAGIEALVNSRYRTPLTPDLVEELRASVEVKRSQWQTSTSASSSSSSTPKISAELFHSMLRRFLFRYLMGDQLNAADGLSLYITDSRLIRWPAEVEDDVDDVFPPSLKVEHSFATYLYLEAELLKVNGKAK